ncbi:MAG: hypothetical protein HOH16_04715 [Planctomycetaceae bacterium]|nr:hypothetical protein [Planctomycetaceae bacterium]
MSRHILYMLCILNCWVPMLCAAEPLVPRDAEWQLITKAIREGKPKTGRDVLKGIEQAAINEQAWDEVARAIATRVLLENSDRPADDPQRLIDLDAATEAAPEQTRGAIQAIQANWTWNFFQMNRWRFAQRTTQVKSDADRNLSEISSWDLRQIVLEIHAQFEKALSDDRGLKELPVDDWAMLIEAGTMGKAYRPTLWDVVVRDAIAFHQTGERGLVEPEDAFELEASSPALQAVNIFRKWRPAQAEAGNDLVTDKDSPILLVISLYQQILNFHADDQDQTAFLSADLDRLLWARGVAVADAETEPDDAVRKALSEFIERAEEHEICAMARFTVAEILRPKSPVEARAIALEAVERHPQSVGAQQCHNLITEIEAKEVAVVTERTWAKPWPALHVTYRNIDQLHLRLVRANWEERLLEGKAYGQGIDQKDRERILSLPVIQSAVVRLPVHDDYQSAIEDLSVESTFVTETIEPGAYWVVGSYRGDFGERDNVVSATLIWVSRISAVNTTDYQPQLSQHTGYVVDVESGKPIHGAEVTAWRRDQKNRLRKMVKQETTETNQDGQYTLKAHSGQETVFIVSSTIAGQLHQVLTEPERLWHRENVERSKRSIVLMTDRGIYRPSQQLHFKGILIEQAANRRRAIAISKASVEAFLQDANGRQISKLSLRTNGFGSFHGTFPIPTGSLPGRWSVRAQGSGATGVAGVRVEEYKRPKYQVELASPTEPVQLEKNVTLSGTALTYTGLAVEGAKVVWNVERKVRFPIWCRWCFPWLPFDSGARRIARGNSVTDADGTFNITFPAVPDRALPSQSLPVFTYHITADVTDAGGETRSADRQFSVGYVDVEATLDVDDWQITNDETVASVTIHVSTLSLDAAPRGIAGTLRLNQLIQPKRVARTDLATRSIPYSVLRKQKSSGSSILPQPQDDDPKTWADGKQILANEIVTDASTGRGQATVQLHPGIYRATFTIPATEDRPEVRATQLVEVLNSKAKKYEIKKPFVLRVEKSTVEVANELRAIVGTGYEQGCCLIEIVQSGRVLKRYWTKDEQTQTPISFKIQDAHRGGVTLRAWMVREGRLYNESQRIDVPWTDKKLSIEWEQFTRRLEPATEQVWQATIRTEADPLAGPARATLAEMTATLYDQSLDALASHQWPMLALFARDSSRWQLKFTNASRSMRQIHGSWARDHQSVRISYHRFRRPFGSPVNGGFGGMLRGGGMARMQRMPTATMAVPEGAMAKGAVAFAASDEMMMEDASADAVELNSVSQGEQESKDVNSQGGRGAASPPPRSNMAETAFFMPTLTSNEAGSVTLEFVLPDTLTTWQFKAFAHDKKIRSGTLFDTCVTSKDLMVEPMPPRFLREGDRVQIPVKVSNKSSGHFSGTVRLALFDARTNDSRDALIQDQNEQSFDLKAGASEAVFFTVSVVDGTDALRYRATGTTIESARRLSDGEEATLPVLPRKVLVTETIPVTVRGGEQRKVVLEKLLDSKQKGSSAIQNESLAIQVVSNPAWYAVMALPYLMERSDESVDALFYRLYANAYAKHLVAGDPRIEKIFEQWRGTNALKSPLEKNEFLVKTLLAETPWVRDATSETEARARVANLFNENRVRSEISLAMERLNSLRNPDGGWPWFPGGRSSDTITLSIVSGFGRLRANGVNIDMTAARAALPWIDARLIEEKRLAEQRQERARKAGNVALASEPVLTQLGVFALYARSFFLADAPPAGEAAEAHSWCMRVGQKSWIELSNNRCQGQLAIALFRGGKRETAESIIESLRQRAAGGPRGEQAADRGEANWQGMWWRNRHPAWWSWAQAPIETQSLMIEAFDEIVGDAESVEAMKAWLIQQKRTSRWSGSPATANAVGVLLGRGADLLGDSSLVEVTVGGEPIKPDTNGASPVEAGTGFFENRFVRKEITPSMAEITFQKVKSGGLAFGGVHWQYLDQIENVEASGRDELAVTKELFTKTMTKSGPVLEPVVSIEKVSVGEELVVRLKITSDRTYEFLELTDHRPSLTEPIDVLSGWRWADGVGWYQVSRDASTQFFFERLPQGTHVLEYSLRVAHRGQSSSGFATIRSRYAPEFSARSQSLGLSAQ